MSGDGADSVENKWKFRFFLLLGLILGQTSAILLDAVISDRIRSILNPTFQVLWIIVLGVGFWDLFKKRLFKRAAIFGAGLVLFLVLFCFPWWCQSHNCSIIKGSPPWGTRIEGK